MKTPSSTVKISRRPFCPPPIRKKIDGLARDFLKAFKSLNTDDGDDWKKAVSKIAKKWGLKSKHHTGLSGTLFVSKKHGLILKRPYTCGRKKPIPAIFTRRINLGNDSDYSYPFVAIQPYADVTSHARSVAYDAIWEVNDKKDLDLSDCHSNNVALFMGKAVCIDW